MNHRIDWSKSDYTHEKAYVMAVFAKIAYLVIPNFELSHRSQAKIIPCLTYQQLIAMQRQVDIGDFLRQADLPDPVVLISNQSVAVGVFRRDVIVIALRGTRPAYVSDWAIDFNARRSKVRVNGQMTRLHTGMFGSTLEFVEQLAREIRDRCAALSPVPPIYVTGHSLGGALTALVHALDNTLFRREHRTDRLVSYDLSVHSAYAFGMPRYGDALAVRRLSGPYHTLNVHDIVPRLPPRSFGFSDPALEYLIDGGVIRRLPQRAPVTFLSLLRKADRLRGVRFHFIERYIQHLGNGL